MSKEPLSISASGLKTLMTCTLTFYYQNVLRIPSATHWKTHCGTLTHTVFECLMNPRRRALFIKIIESGEFKVRDYPSIVRCIEMFFRRYDITLSSVEEIGELVNVAFIGIRKYFLDKENKYSPPPFFENERKFKVAIRDATARGFIDLLILWGDTVDKKFTATHGVVIDLKSQGTKFTKADLPNNIQAAIYQAACYHEFGVIPAVEFIMLRHGPTTRTPDKHIQRVEPPSLAVLQGLEIYISSTYQRVNQFSLEDACQFPNPDTGFCERVCSYLRPFTYWVVCAADDPQGLETIYGHLTLDSAKKACSNGQTILERTHKGCRMRWNG